MRKSAIALAIAVLMVAACSRRVADRSVDELLDSGWDRYRLGEYDLAADAFDAAAEQFPENDARHVGALYGQATVWNLRTPIGRQDRELASDLYRRITTEFPDSAEAPWSALALARMEHLVPIGKEPDFDAVRDAYRSQVIEAYPDHPAAEEATVYLLSTYVATLLPGDARKALEGLERFVAEHPDSGFLSAAHGLAAMSCETLGHAERQLAHGIKSLDKLERDPRNPFYDVSWRYWQLAVTAEFEAGDFPAARRYYRKLLDEYPLDIRCYGAREALKRMDRVESELRAGKTETPS